MAKRSKRRPTLPGQVVLVLQGGGALGAYQVGVYEALHEAGIEPDWVIGTSIGAINAALIAANRPEDRIARLPEFWQHVEQDAGHDLARFFIGLANVPANLATITRGIPAFFAPIPFAWAGPHVPLGVERAAYYTTAPLRETLAPLVDFDVCNGHRIRLTVGAVNVRNGEMRYFDSRDETDRARPRDRFGRAAAGLPGCADRRRSVLGRRHLLEHSDRGRARRQAAQGLGDLRGQHVEPRGPRARDDLAGAGAAEGHPVREPRAEPHRAPEADPSPAARDPRDCEARAVEARRTPELAELASWGCGTTMHVARLTAPKLDGEDHTKDIDFTPAGIRARWQAGYAATRRMLARAPWNAPVDPIEGVIIHDIDAAGARADAHAHAGHGVRL